MAAPARPYWKGYLQLSLVSCPISLYTAASSSERVAFRQINKQTGNRLRQQLIDEVTQKPVSAEDKGRGYEYAKGVYLQVEDEELEAIAIESSHMIGVDRFVPRAQIDERYLDSPYYIVPNDKVGQEAFAVIREANGYITREAPWALKKTDPVRMELVLRHLHDALRAFATVLQPFMPATMAALLDQLGVPAEARALAALATPLPGGIALPPPAPLLRKAELAA